MVDVILRMLRTIQLRILFKYFRARIYQQNIMSFWSILGIIIVIIILIAVIAYFANIIAPGIYFTNSDNPLVRLPTNGAAVSSTKDGVTFLHPLGATMGEDGFYRWPQYDNMILIMRDAPGGATTAIKMTASPVGDALSVGTKNGRVIHATASNESAPNNSWIKHHWFAL